MNYMERYQNGEFESVWNELQALGAGVRQEPALSLARQVAAETMRRVRRDCELLVSRLQSIKYTLGIYPDGSEGYYSEGPLVKPSKNLQKDLHYLQERFGRIPLSLEAFWQEVGSVDLVGMGPSWPRELDPLVVNPPVGALIDLEDMEEDNPEGPLQGGLAPDYLHKDNVSGGSPYAVGLPCDLTDFLLLNERHELLFVPYLRFSILRWGGFPGLDGRELDFPPLKILTEGLIPF